jgi:hypothetical protein
MLAQVRGGQQSIRRDRLETADAGMADSGGTRRVKRKAAGSPTAAARAG